MKKLLLILTAAISMNVTFIQAQIPNNGFENLNFDGTISNWGNVYIFSVTIDTNGTAVQDSIVYDNQFYFPTNDAHSGLTAIEMRNAFNFTTNQGIAGKILSTSDSVFSGFNSFSLINVQNNPTSLSFYYKYFPVNNDSAIAYLEVFDSLSNKIGEAVVVIGGTVSNYTLATAPIIYSAPGSVALYTLSFCTAYNLSTGILQPSLGTRFLVDDVSLDGITGIHESGFENQIGIYPNPTTGKFFINVDSRNSDFEMELSNISGSRILKFKNEKAMDVSFLKSGIYILNIRSKDSNYIQKFIKE